MSGVAGALQFPTAVRITKQAPVKIGAFSLMAKQQPALSPLSTGLACRCPRCGEGPLFNGYLKIAGSCESCGLDLSFAESGDGPAVFIIFIVGFIIIMAALIVDNLFHPPVIVHLILWLPATLALCLALLRPFKATMIALQFKHDAHEGRLD